MLVLKIVCHLLCLFRASYVAISLGLKKKKVPHLCAVINVIRFKLKNVALTDILPSFCYSQVQPDNDPFKHRLRIKMIKRRVACYVKSPELHHQAKRPRTQQHSRTVRLPLRPKTVFFFPSDSKRLELSAPRNSPSPCPFQFH